MIKIKRFMYSPFILFSVSIVLFIIGYLTHQINAVILYMLEFTVIFELVRGFTHYLKDGQLKVRYGIDAAIFYSIKELYIGFVEFKIDSDPTLIMVSLVAFVILMFGRFINSKMIEEKRKYCEYNDGDGNCTKDTFEV